jgi:hypothetical protein
VYGYRILEEPTSILRTNIPQRESLLAIENRRENFTGSISYMSVTLLTQKLLNVSGQIVTNRGLNKKNIQDKN